MNDGTMSLEEWEEKCGRLPVRRMRPMIWACPRCKFAVSTQGELCEICEGEIVRGDDV